MVDNVYVIDLNVVGTLFYERFKVVTYE
jgi:hypothetical protein